MYMIPTRGCAGLVSVLVVVLHNHSLVADEPSGSVSRVAFLVHGHEPTVSSAAHNSTLLLQLSSLLNLKIPLTPTSDTRETWREVHVHLYQKPREKPSHAQTEPERQARHHSAGQMREYPAPNAAFASELLLVLFSTALAAVTVCFLAHYR